MPGATKTTTTDPSPTGSLVTTTITNPHDGGGGVVNTQQQLNDYFGENGRQHYNSGSNVAGDNFVFHNNQQYNASTPTADLSGNISNNSNHFHYTNNTDSIFGADFHEVGNFSNGGSNVVVVDHNDPGQPIHTNTHPDTII